ncbi:MAG: hypothetical protein MHMPM18_000397 [Marteilia pararefringens]
MASLLKFATICKINRNSNSLRYFSTKPSLFPPSKQWKLESAARVLGITSSAVFCLTINDHAKFITMMSLLLSTHIEVQNCIEDYLKTGWKQRTMKPAVFVITLASMILLIYKYKTNNLIIKT